MKFLWWEWNYFLCVMLPGYREWQKTRSLADCIPVITWLMKFGPGEINEGRCPS